MVIRNRLCKNNVSFDDSYHMVLALCKLEQIRKLIIWQFAVIGRLPYFCGKIGVYVVIYRSKDKNTTQGNLAELVGSPVAPIWCK